MRTVGYIRTAELGVTLASTYMTAVTLIQTSIYGKLKPYAIGFLHPILEAYGIDPAYLDIILHRLGRDASGYHAGVNSQLDIGLAGQPA